MSSTFLAAKILTEIRDFLLERLHATGWRDSYPVFVGVWDDNVVCTPSAQLWLPRPGEGKPVVEGVFEQTVIGEVTAFAAAARASLPEPILRRLHGESEQIAACNARHGGQLHGGRRHSGHGPGIGRSGNEPSEFA